VLLMTALLASCFGVTSAMDGAFFPSSPRRMGWDITRGGMVDATTYRAHGDRSTRHGKCARVWVWTCPGGQRAALPEI
jgi:hypothetical protein